MEKAIKLYTVPRENVVRRDHFDAEASRMNPLVQLKAEGQSFWIDYIKRSWVRGGGLKKWIDEDGLRGLTSNPSIFEKAISSESDYDQDIRKLAAQGASNKDIFQALAVEDIRQAADAFKQVFASSGGEDGYVSIEVDPTLAHKTEETVREAEKLARLVDRPNVMIKIPATPEGLPAIRQATAAGLNVNITLLFSVEAYKQVVEAYWAGLEDRLKKKLSLKSVRSVASFFVSRVDKKVDKKLDELVARKDAAAGRLLHKAGVANAKNAYRYLQESQRSERWRKLAGEGAAVQRLLWGSTSAKDERLPDVHYINELIGPQTVNTIPPETAEAFRDHGVVKATAGRGQDDAAAAISELGALDIDLARVCDELLAEGVEAFSKSHAAVLRAVENKKKSLSGTAR
jgi:transaldolase